MNWKLGTFIALVVLGLVGVGIFVVGKARSSPGVTVMIRIAVDPEQQLDFVIRQADSAKFKYLVGKRCGVKPALAQKLLLKRVPKSSLLEVQVSVITRDEGRCYVEAFMEALQGECAGQAQVTLAQQSIR